MPDPWLIHHLLSARDDLISTRHRHYPRLDRDLTNQRPLGRRLVECWCLPGCPGDPAFLPQALDTGFTR